MKQDQDIEFMDRMALKAEVKKLRNGIREYLGHTKHDMCKINRQILGGLVPDLPAFDPSLPAKEEFIGGCNAYYDACAKEGKVDPAISVRPQYDVVTVPTGYGDYEYDKQKISDAIRIYSFADPVFGVLAVSGKPFQYIEVAAHWTKKYENVGGPNQYEGPWEFTGHARYEYVPEIPILLGRPVIYVADDEMTEETRKGIMDLFTRHQTFRETFDVAKRPETDPTMDVERLPPHSTGDDGS